MSRFHPTSWKPIAGLIIGNIVSLSLMYFTYQLYLKDINDVVEGAGFIFLLRMLIIVPLGSCIVGLFQETLAQKETFFLIFISPGVLASLFLFLIDGPSVTSFSLDLSFTLITLSLIGLAIGYAIGRFFRAIRSFPHQKSSYLAPIDRSQIK